MTAFSGSVTIHGSNGSSAGIVITTGNDSFGLPLASSWQSITAAQLISTPSSFSTLAPNSFIALENNLGEQLINGASGAGTVLAGDGTSVAYFGPATLPSAISFVGGNGTNYFSGGDGNDTVALGGGNGSYAEVNSGIVDASGNNQTVIGGSGNTVVTITGSNSFVSEGRAGGTLVVHDEQGTNNTIFTGDSNTVYGASAGNTTIDVGGTTTVYAGAGGTSFLQSAGSFVLNDSVSGSVTASVTGGSPDTLYGASGANISLTSTVAGNIFVANDPSHTVGGAVTLNGANASGGSQFWAGSGNASLVGGTGTDTIVAGNGASTITGGSGAFNYFDFLSTNGGSNTQVTITDFGSASGNLLTFFGYGASQAAAIIAQGSNQVAIGGVTSTVIGLSDGTKITLVGYQNGLSSSNVHYT